MVAESKIYQVCAIISSAGRSIPSGLMDGGGGVPNTARNAPRPAAAVKLRPVRRKRRRRSNHVAPAQGLQKGREGRLALRQSRGGAFGFHGDEARQKIAGGTDCLHRDR